MDPKLLEQLEKLEEKLSDVVDVYFVNKLEKVRLLLDLFYRDYFSFVDNYIVIRTVHRGADLFFRVLLDCEDVIGQPMELMTLSEKDVDLLRNLEHVISEKVKQTVATVLLTVLRDIVFELSFKARCRGLTDVAEYAYDLHNLLQILTTLALEGNISDSLISCITLQIQRGQDDELTFIAKIFTKSVAVTVDLGQRDFSPRAVLEEVRKAVQSLDYSLMSQVCKKIAHVADMLKKTKT